ncbi:MAG: CBS domain-containing protein [Nitrosarchaeum sp.]|nr:CBS domain-containing protein [Nitrosarchaeum sp.]
MSVLEYSQSPISISKNITISQVIKKLLESNFSRLIVTESGKPVGIVTEKDIGLFLFSNTSNQGLDDIPLAKIMKPLIFVDETTSMQDAAKILIEKEVSSLVSGTNEKIIGIITKTDFVSYYLNNTSNNLKVVDYMSKDYVFTHTAAPLFKVIRKMLQNRISRIIVKDQKENQIGIISFRDLFRISIELGSEEDDSGFTISNQIRKGFLSEGGFGNISLARDVMTKKIIAIKFNQNLSDACRIILENNVSGLAVQDGNGSIAGIISKTDIIRAIVK